VIEMPNDQAPIEIKPQGAPGRPPTRKCLSDALRIAVNAKGVSGEKKVREIAENLVDQAVAGDLEATKIIFDRLEGKAPQPVVGDEDNPIVHALKVRFV
jgi:hypothetical protein